VRLLEERLQARGWGGSVFLRPTVQAVHQPPEGKPLERVFVQAWDEMNAHLGTRVPHLTVGFSFGGLLATFAPSPLRLCICAPWAELPADAIQKASVRSGWRVLQGDLDQVVAPEPNLAVLPEQVPVTRDPQGSHDFDAWMDRIADWVQASWDAFQTA
jgi:alpha/beta superfamily hydrolase